MLQEEKPIQCNDDDAGHDSDHKDNAEDDNIGEDRQRQWSINRVAKTTAQAKTAATTSTKAQTRTRTKTKTKGKTKAGLDRQRVHDDGMDLMLTATAEADAPDIKCVFVPRLQKKLKKNSEVEAIPLWPQYTALWRTAQFKEQKWLVVSSQTRWLQLLVTASVRMSMREVVARLCELAKNEFDTQLTRERRKEYMKYRKAKEN